jgi:hypothetical protein
MGRTGQRSHSEALYMPSAFPQGLKCLRENYTRYL